MMPLTWTGLRGDRERVGWYRKSDLLAAAVAVGAKWTEWNVRKAVRGLPKPPKKYGHLRYGPEHLEAVLESARASLDP